MTLSESETTEFGMLSGDLILDGPDPFDSQILVISADTNFNGTIEANEEQRTQVTSSQQRGTFSFQMRDDGPVPGNGTPSDPITIRAVFVNDTKEVTAIIKNIDPVIVGAPSVVFGSDYVDVSVSILDPGLLDSHKIIVKFGDGTETSSAWYHSITMGCEITSAHSVRRNFSVPFAVFPLTIKVIDDDTGATERTFSKLSLNLNNNDSNDNSVNDLFDSGFNDPDLKAITNLLVAPMDSETGSLRLVYNTGVVRLWDSPKKEKLIAPYGGEFHITDWTVIPYTGQSTMWAEGVGTGATDVYVSWTPNDSSNLNGRCMAEMVGNIVRVNVVGVDLDIDSDNDEGTSPTFEHDDWNEYLEDSKYAIGKMIFPRPLTEPLPEWVPFTLQISGMDWSSSVAFFYESRGVSSGTVEIWKKSRNDPTRTGADKIPWALWGPTAGQTLYHPLNQFGQGQLITLWLQMENRPATNFKLVDPTKPEDFLIAKVKDWSGQIWEDRIKYMNQYTYSSGNVDFYPALQSNLHWRGAGASEAVYGAGGANALPSDNVKLTLKMLKQDDLEKLFNADPFLSTHAEEKAYLMYFLTSTAPPPPTAKPTIRAAGLAVRLYLDHCDTGNGRYILSYRGTDFESTDDWITNLQQFLGGQAPAYRQAMDVSADLGKSIISFDITGHSLGGGLAAAAMLNSDRSPEVTHAFTFNAAGLNPLVFMDTSHVPYIVAYPVANANYPNSSQFIDTFSVWYVRPVNFDGPTENTIVSDSPDILTMLQFTFSQPSPNALVTTNEPDGLFHPMEGLIDLTKKEYRAISVLLTILNNYRLGRITLTDSLTAIAVHVAIFGVGEIYTKLPNSHRFPSIYFGLMHNLEGWNVYDRNDHPGY